MHETTKLDLKSEDKKSEQSDQPAPFLYDTIVIVLVGPEKQRFDLHKGLLCKWSDFFQAALNGKFQEADGKVNLPEQDPDTFRYFVYWLYTGKLTNFNHPATVGPDIALLRLDANVEVLTKRVDTIQDLPTHNAKKLALYQAIYRDTPFSSLIRLYILADILQVPALGDPLITLLIERYGCCSSKRNRKDASSVFWDQDADIEDAVIGINEAFVNLPATSNLCCLLVHFVCDTVLEISQ